MIVFQRQSFLIGSRTNVSVGMSVLPPARKRTIAELNILGYRTEARATVGISFFSITLHRISEKMRSIQKIDWHYSFVIILQRWFGFKTDRISEKLRLNQKIDWHYCFVLLWQRWFGFKVVTFVSETSQTHIH